MDKKYVPQHKQMAMGSKKQAPCPTKKGSTKK